MPAAIAPLLLLILIDAVGFAMLTPLLASALAAGSGAPLQAGLSDDGRHLVYGVATGLYPLMTFFGAPLLGQLSDRVGRRLVLLVCAGGIVASYATISVAFAQGSVALLLLGRLVGGATAASQAVSLAALVDVCPPRSKDFWLSMGLLSSSLGFVIGPALSGLLSDPGIVSWFTLDTPLHATALLAGLNLAMLAVLFHDPADRTRSRARQPPLSPFGGFRSLAAAFTRPGALRDVSWVFLLQELAWGAYFYFIPVLLLQRFAATPGQTSLFMSVMGIGFCISFAVAMPVLTRYCATRRIALGSLAVTSGLIAVSALAPSMTVEWMVILPISIAVAVSYGALIMLFTDSAGEAAKGEVMGITAAINALAFGVVSLLGGAAASFHVGTPLLAALVLMTASAVVLGLQPARSTKQEPRPST